MAAWERCFAHSTRCSIAPWPSKSLSKVQSNDEETLRRFKNEAQSAARLDHENIGRVHYVGEDHGWHYIVFEFIEGVNLRDLVDRDGPLLAGRRGQLHSAGGRRSRPMPRARRGPSRYQAVERFDRAGRASQARRYGAGAAAPSGALGRRFDCQRRHAGNVRLYLARTSPRSAQRRRPQRYLLARLHGLFHADPPAAVSRGNGIAEVASASSRRAGGSAVAASGSARRIVQDPAADAGQSAGAALSAAGGVDSRFACVVNQVWRYRAPSTTAALWLGESSSRAARWARHIPWAAPMALLLLVAVVLAVANRSSDADGKPAPIRHASVPAVDDARATEPAALASPTPAASSRVTSATAAGSAKVGQGQPRTPSPDSADGSERAKDELPKQSVSGSNPASSAASAREPSNAPRSAAAPLRATQPAGATRIDIR